MFEGGLNPGEQYIGAINFSDTGRGLGTFGGLGGMGTYNLLYHIVAHTRGVEPCGTLCYRGGYFAGHRDQLLIESLNDAISILSGTGTQLGQDVPGFGTSDIAKWATGPPRPELGQRRPAGASGRRGDTLRHERVAEPEHLHDGH